MIFHKRFLFCERCSEEEGKVINSVHSIIKTETNTWGNHTVNPKVFEKKIKVLGSYRLLDGILRKEYYQDRDHLTRNNFQLY